MPALSIDWSRVRVDAWHVILLVLSTFGGAVLSYLQSQPTETIVQALASWPTARPMLLGALATGLGAVVLMAKQSFLLKAPPWGFHCPDPLAHAPDSPRGGPTASFPGLPRHHDDPPAKVRGRLTAMAGLVRFARAAAACAVVSTVAATAGCSAWWQELRTNPQAAVAQLLQYVATFSSGAQALWSVVSPFLAPAVQNKANVDLAMAVTTLSSASAALQDAVKAAAAAQEPSPDFSALIADVQAAAANVMTILRTYAAAPGDAGAAVVGLAPDATAHLAHQAQVIATWEAR